MNDTRPIDTLVHLGAGRGASLDDFFADDSAKPPRRALLVEVDEERARGLERRVAALPEHLAEHIRVERAAVSATPGAAVYYRCNLEDASGLHAPTGLQSLYPGLEVEARQEVEAVAPDTLVAPLGLSRDEHNLLVLELPGEELAVLEALGERLLDFAELRLRCGREVLFEGGRSARAVLAWLEEAGFELTSEDSDDDPEWPWWRLRRNDVVLQNRELSRRVEALERSLAEQTRTAEHRRARIQELRLQHSRAEEAETAGAAEREKLEKDLARCRQELETAQTRLRELEAEVEERGYRQRLLDEELLKAEAQIELIKDVLLREQSV